MKNIALNKLCYLLHVLLLLALTGCGASRGNGSAVPAGSGSLAAKLVWGGSVKSAGKTVASVPVEVASIRMTVSGAGLPVVRNEFAVQAGASDQKGTVTGIYPGKVSLVAQGLGADTGEVLFEGFALYVPITDGHTTDVGNIMMTAPTLKAADTGCILCHETTVDKTGQNLVAQFKQSGHYRNTAFLDSNGVGAGCAGCHGPSHNTVDPSAGGVSARCFDCHNDNATTIANHGNAIGYLANGTPCSACHEAHKPSRHNRSGSHTGGPATPIPPPPAPSPGKIPAPAADATTPRGLSPSSPIPQASASRRLPILRSSSARLAIATLPPARCAPSPAPRRLRTTRPISAGNRSVMR